MRSGFKSAEHVGNHVPDHSPKDTSADGHMGQGFGPAQSKVGALPIEPTSHRHLRGGASRFGRFLIAASLHFFAFFAFVSASERICVRKTSEPRGCIA
jgi:hypothetical protein